MAPERQDWAAREALIRRFWGFDPQNSECENESQYLSSPTISASGTFYTPHSHLPPPGDCSEGRLEYTRPSGPWAGATVTRGGDAIPPAPTAAPTGRSPWVVGVNPPADDCNKCPEKPGIPSQVYRPFRSKEARASSQVPANVTDGVFQQIVTLRAPRGYNLVVREWGQQCPFPASFADIQWRFTVDGLPQHGLTNIRSQQGTPVFPSEILVKCIEEQTIALEARKLTPGVVLASGAIYGYIFAPVLNVGDDHWTGWMGY